MTHDESARDYYEENQKLKAENAKLRRVAKILIAFSYCNHQDCKRCKDSKNFSLDCVEAHLERLIKEFEVND